MDPFKESNLRRVFFFPSFAARLLFSPLLLVFPSAVNNTVLQHGVDFAPRGYIQCHGRGTPKRSCSFKPRLCWKFVFPSEERAGSLTYSLTYLDKRRKKR